MRVIIGCEYSQVVTKAFREKGHEAYSCDILDTEGNPDWHIKGDILDHLDDGWGIGIFHPDCTYLTNAGVRWLMTDPGRFIKMYHGAEFFLKLLNSKIPKICVENPVPHGYAMVKIKQPYTQIIQPFQYGHTTSKATCLWLKNLPELIATNNVYDEMMKLPKAQRNECHYASPGPDRGKIRAKFYEGWGKAMADQWGELQ